VCWWLETLQNGIRAKLQALSLDGMNKWLLEPRFQVEIVSRGKTFVSANRYLGRVTMLRRCIAIL
jgi:hypothetical protein